MNIIETIRLIKSGNEDIHKVSLNFVRYEMDTILMEVSKIHLQSAEQAFISAITSNSPEMELRVGLGHLRDVFNTYENYLENGRKLFGLFKLEWWDERKTDINLKLASIASVISLIYKNIEDYSNYSSWKIIALNCAEPYLRNRLNSIKHLKEGKEKFISASGAVHTIDRPEMRERYANEVGFVKEFEDVLKLDL